MINTFIHKINNFIRENGNTYYIANNSYYLFDKYSICLCVIYLYLPSHETVLLVTYNIDCWWDVNLLLIND